MHQLVRLYCISWCILSGCLSVCVVSHSLDWSKGQSNKTEELSSHSDLLFLKGGAKVNAPLSYEGLGYSIEEDDLFTCGDLKGVGSFDTTCLLNSSVHSDRDVYVFGTGSMEILPDSEIVCPIEGCTISFNLSGSIKFGQNAAIVAGTISLSAYDLIMGCNSSVNASSLGGAPPSQTSGTPIGYDRDGGGHGGRGAACSKTNLTNFWGGDVYGWSTLLQPWSYGSKGSGISVEHNVGGSGGGRVRIDVKDTLCINGSVSADGGDGTSLGGGGSGGSIIIRAQKLKGFGMVSAAGGSGWGGGGGGRISMHCFSKQEDVKVTVHGGLSIGCSWNSGAAGTYFDASVQSLRIGNDNFSTETETPLLHLSTSPPWTNVYIENHAKVLVPLLWTRIQVRGQISLLSGSRIIFGLSEYPVSEFELVAEELLMSESVIKVYGALRVYVKMLLMLSSQIQVDGGGNSDVATSILEMRNLVILKENSVISSNGNLALSGQGLLKLTGQGDAIKAQRLSLSLFYNIIVGVGSIIQSPLDGDSNINLVTESLCETATCPVDLITPPDDCHANYTFSSSMQVCRVEDILVNGTLKGSVIHIYRATNMIVSEGAVITASGLGCRTGIGMGNYLNGVGAGAGHGGRGGSGYFNGILNDGGKKYGSADFPCELGSGTESPDRYDGSVGGGGMIVIGSKQWPLLNLESNGIFSVDGQSSVRPPHDNNGTIIGGPGGGSGGSVLLFLQSLILAENSSLSAAGGYGSSLGGGGGGGGRIHFHWSKIYSGDKYLPLAFVSGAIDLSGGAGGGDGLHGEKGTITGKQCPKGLYGTFCTECPVGTFKDVEGSDSSSCKNCSTEQLPSRAIFIYLRGGVTQSSCPYNCISDKYRMPNCYTPFEEMIYTFGGPWPFALLLLCLVVLLALLLTMLRSKLVEPRYAFERESSIGRSSDPRFPYFLSLSEVCEAKVEEAQSHVHRMYFMGPNTFREPWHLPYSPPAAIVDIVYEDAFYRFIDEINSLAAYEWWEGSLYVILSVLACPCAWSWRQWCRRNKIHQLKEFVKSEYDHSCLRSCRSRALYKGMKVGATTDLAVSYIDFFLGGDEKRLDLVNNIHKRFPMRIIFGGDGSYMSPYNLYSDSIVTSLIAQHVPTTVWNRFVGGLNAQLRMVRQGSVQSSLVPVIHWLSTHGNIQLMFHGVNIELGWFQATTSGYYQLGILVVAGDGAVPDLHYSRYLDLGDEPFRSWNVVAPKNTRISEINQVNASNVLSRKNTSVSINGGVINEATLKSLSYKRGFFFPFFLLMLTNSRPVGRQDTVQFLVTLLLLMDLSVTLLMLFLFYSMSIGAFLAVLLILPLSLLCPFPAGLNALLTDGPRRASLARVYALWNATSVSNTVVAFVSGIIHYVITSVSGGENSNTGEDDGEWWVLPTVLVVVKIVQARFVDWQIANLEVKDLSLFSPDPDAFWAYESL